MNCNLVIQYLCQKDGMYPKDHKEKVKNGRTTNTPTFTGGRVGEKRSATLSRMNSNLNKDRVLQEQWKTYEKCNIRNRNKGNCLIVKIVLLQENFYFLCLIMKLVKICTYSHKNQIKKYGNFLGTV